MVTRANEGKGGVTEFGSTKGLLEALSSWFWNLKVNRLKTAKLNYKINKDILFTKSGAQGGRNYTKHQSIGWYKNLTTKDSRQETSWRRQGSKQLWLRFTFCREVSFRIWKRHKTQSIIATFFKAAGSSEERGDCSTAVPEASHSNYYSTFPRGSERRLISEPTLRSPFLRHAHTLVLEGTFLVTEWMFFKWTFFSFPHPLPCPLSMRNLSTLQGTPAGLDWKLLWVIFIISQGEEM